MVFGNEAIPLRIWPWLLAGGLVFFLVVETEKMVIRSSDSLQRTITAVEAGHRGVQSTYAPSPCASTSRAIQCHLASALGRRSNG
jgi:hypothetical protein